MLDGTVVNVALPAIGRDLDAAIGGLQWIVNGYTLTLAALILLGGSLGDRFGRRRVFVRRRGLVRRRVAAVRRWRRPSGADRRPGAAGRRRRAAHAGQPGHPAGVVPAARTGPGRSAPGPASAGSPAAIGPFARRLAGRRRVGWRLVFLINLPLAAVVVLVALRHVPETPGPRGDRASSTSPARRWRRSASAGLTYGLIAWPVDGFGGPRASPIAAGRRRRAGRLRRGRARAAAPDAAAGASSRRRQFTARQRRDLRGLRRARRGRSSCWSSSCRWSPASRPFAAGAALLPVTVIMLLLVGARSGALAAADRAAAADDGRTAGLRRPGCSAAGSARTPLPHRRAAGRRSSSASGWR